MKKKIIVVFVILILMTLIPTVSSAVTPIEVNCPDTALNHALHDKLGTAYTEPLLNTQLMMLTGLLDLSNLGIRDITGLEYLKGVEAFDLGYNEIDELTPEFCDMVASHSVESLILSGNNLGQLPSSLGSSSLKRLLVDVNMFYSFPSVITDITSLEILYIHGNRISSIPSSLPSMPNLETITVSANRLRTLPSSFSGISIGNFICEYNFIDMSPGSESKDILDSMAVAGTFRYENQLPIMQGLAVEYPDNGVVKFSWDPGSDISFSDGNEAEFARITILQDGEYIENITPDKTEYVVEGLNVGEEYIYSFSFDYTVSDPVYDGILIRTYEKITATPETLAEPTSAPEISAELSPELSHAVSESATPQVTIAVSDEPTTAPLLESEEETAETGIQISTTLIVLLSAIAGLLIVLIVVIIITSTKKRKNAGKRGRKTDL